MGTSARKKPNRIGEKELLKLLGGGDQSGLRRRSEVGVPELSPAEVAAYVEEVPDAEDLDLDEVAEDVSRSVDGHLVSALTPIPTDEVDFDRVARDNTPTRPSMVPDPLAEAQVPDAPKIVPSVNPAAPDPDEKNSNPWIVAALAVIAGAIGIAGVLVAGELMRAGPAPLPAPIVPQGSASAVAPAEPPAPVAEPPSTAAAPAPRQAAPPAAPDEVGEPVAESVPEEVEDLAMQMEAQIEAARAARSATRSLPGMSTVNPPAAVTPAPEMRHPATPSREAVRRTLEGARSAVSRCAGGRHGTALMRVTAVGSGHVTTAALISGPFKGTAEGSCMARAMRTMRFPEFSQPRFTVEFPYNL